MHSLSLFLVLRRYENQVTKISHFDGYCYIDVLLDSLTLLHLVAELSIVNKSRTLWMAESGQEKLYLYIYIESVCWLCHIQGVDMDCIVVS
jgi:hypothetical protein